MAGNGCHGCAAGVTCAGSGVSVKDSFPGERATDVDFTVALGGNPNTGKSTVFNVLTGLHQHTGNWPGKTVARAEGVFQHNGSSYRLVDLPGTYSLLAATVDEEVARDYLLFGQPDVTVIVVDATRLERNLNLVLQVLEITDRAVICLNLVDEAQRHGIEVDAAKLSGLLGVPVVPTSARFRTGISDLLAMVDAGRPRRGCLRAAPGAGIRGDRARRAGASGRGRAAGDRRHPQRPVGRPATAGRRHADRTGPSRSRVPRRFGRQGGAD